MAKTISPRLGQTRWSSAQDTVQRLDFDTDAANLDANVALFKEGTLASRPSAGTTGRFYTVKNDDASLNGRQYYDNGVAWTAPSYGANVLVEATDAAKTPLTVKGPASATAPNILAVNDSSNTTIFRVTNSGVTTNQSSIGTSAGAYFGRVSSHAAAGWLVSVDAGKPVLVAQAAASQTAPVFSVNTSNNSTVASITAAGNATFNGTVNAGNIITGGLLTALNITSAGTSALTSLTATAGSSDVAAATFKAAASQSVNLLEFFNGSNTRIARITNNGSFTTSGSMAIGDGFGNGTTQDFSAQPILNVQNTVGASVPLVRLTAFAGGQSGKALEVLSSSNALLYSIDGSGNVNGSANAHFSTATVGPGIVQPNSILNGSTPVFEVNTGTEVGTYSQQMVVRHSAKDTTAVSRSVGLRLALGDDSNINELRKSAGMSVVSTSASAATPNLVFYNGNVEAARFDDTSNLVVANNLNVVGSLDSNPTRMYGAQLKFNGDTATLGLQTSNTVYNRANQFVWYRNGSHNDTAFNSGGGETIATLTGGSDNRFSVGRLSLAAATSIASTTPVLVIGDQAGTHMQFSNQSIQSYTNSGNTSAGILYLQADAASGGTLVLGDNGTQVQLRERTLYFGTNRLYVGFGTWGATGGSPIENDWWFDGTNNQIKVRLGNNTWKIVAS